MLFFLFFLCVWMREIAIAPKNELVFLSAVTQGTIYKFYYSTRTPVDVTLVDPNGTEIVSTNDKSATIYTQISETGRIKAIIKNMSNETCLFNYMCPDVNKEIAGHVGFVKDIDMVSELARVLDDLIYGQQLLVERTIKHQKMVASSRFWGKILMGIEFALTGFAIYVMHQDFINLFEKKQSF